MDVWMDAFNTKKHQQKQFNLIRNRPFKNTHVARLAWENCVSRVLLPMLNISNHLQQV